MNLLKNRSAGKPSPAKKQIQPGQEVELIRILWQNQHVSDRVRIEFRHGEELSLSGGVELLQDFQKFQRYAFLHFGIWIRHSCERATSSCEAAAIWGDAVEIAILATGGDQS